MARLPLQVLVLPFRHRIGGQIEFAIFRRRDFADACWQGVAGGVEHGESAEQAARREMTEEASIPIGGSLVPLDAMATIPVTQFSDRNSWEPNVYVVTERAFGARVEDAQTIVLSGEHSEYRWVPYEEAVRLLRWDSNRTALWELNERLKRTNPLPISTSI